MAMGQPAGKTCKRMEEAAGKFALLSEKVLTIQMKAGTESRSLQDHDQLDRGFRRLKPDQRIAVVLHFYLELSVPEVADALGVPVGTAKSRIHYAVEALRAALEADERASIATTGGLVG